MMTSDSLNREGSTANRVAVFFDDRMVSDANVFSPSAAKPAQVWADWQASGLPVELHAVTPAAASEIDRVHDPDYVRGVLDGRVSTGHGVASRELAESCRWTCGSMADAATFAFRTGRVACSPSSGFHHAHFDSGGGFCTFNGLMVAALRVLDMMPADQRIAIVDFDNHYGDGTQDILEHLRLEDRILHWTYGAHDFRGRNWQANVMQDCRRFIREASSNAAALVLYQAGADIHEHDPLCGSRGFSTEQMIERDELVFAECRSLALPVAWNLAGGYQRERDGSIPKVLELHRNTMRVCAETFCLPQ